MALVGAEGATGAHIMFRDADADVPAPLGTEGPPRRQSIRGPHADRQDSYNAGNWCTRLPARNGFRARTRP